jgi:GT2 family glycosyltransferase
VVFLDNDVRVCTDWLDEFLKCAIEEKADVVGPLLMEKYPGVYRVHSALGEVCLLKSNGVTTLVTKSHPYRVSLKQFYALKIPRQSTELVELHCVLIRSQVLRELGGFDEKIYNTRIHVDFCMNLNNRGKKIYFEPKSRSTFVYPIPLPEEDLAFFNFRWNLNSYLDTVNYFTSKWNVKISDQHLDYFNYYRTWILKLRSPLNRFLLLYWVEPMRTKYLAIIKLLKKTKRNLLKT